MKLRVRMLLVPPIADLPRKNLPAMPTNITTNHRQPKLADRFVRDRQRDFLYENEPSVRLIED